MFDVTLYLALEDETWRLSTLIDYGGATPTVYRQGATYVVRRASLESDVLWLDCAPLLRLGPDLYGLGQPDCSLPCTDGDEWAHLLLESGVSRNVYFTAWAERDTDPLVGTLDKPVSSMVQ